MEDFDRSAPPPGRLQSLSVRREGKIGRGYTVFVKSMRILLPLVAVALVGLVITWPDMEKRVEPMKREELLPDTANMQNELLQPKFESVDQKNQPYTVTADLATQSRDNPDIINLDKPAGSLTMSDGGIVAMQAETGIYQQRDEKLFLKGTVKLMNDTGYTLESDEMRVNLQTSEAFSDKDVHVQGPDGTIEAAGLEGNSEKGLLIFKGPAKMILNEAGQALSLEGNTPR